MDEDTANLHAEAKDSNPNTPIVPASSTPKPGKGRKFKKPLKTSKAGNKSNVSLGSSPGPSTGSSKRERSSSSDHKTGFTPENKKAGLGDEVLEAFGDFSASSGLNEDSLSSLETAIIQNRAGVKLKRIATHGSEPTESAPPPPKEIKMAKRTGIEIRFFKKDGIYNYALEIEAWTKVKDQVQEQMFDNGLLETFGKIVSTPYNARGPLAYGAITFQTVTDAEEMFAHLTKFVFGFPVSMQLIKPCRFFIRFRVYGMVAVDSKKVANAILQLNQLEGSYTELHAATVSDAADCRQFVMTPDEKLLAGFRALESTGARIKTGFNSTLFKIIENKQQE